MRNKIRYIRLIGLIFVLIVGSSLTFAQNKSKRKSAKKPLVEVVSIVTDEKGSPLKNVSIICGEGAVRSVYKKILHLPAFSDVQQS